MWLTVARSRPGDRVDSVAMSSEGQTQYVLVQNRAEPAGNRLLRSRDGGMNFEVVHVDQWVTGFWQNVLCDEDGLRVMMMDPLRARLLRSNDGGVAFVESPAPGAWQRLRLYGSRDLRAVVVSFVRRGDLKLSLDGGDFVTRVFVPPDANLTQVKYFQLEQLVLGDRWTYILSEELHDGQMQYRLMQTDDAFQWRRELRVPGRLLPSVLAQGGEGQLGVCTEDDSEDPSYSWWESRDAGKSWRLLQQTLAAPLDFVLMDDFALLLTQTELLRTHDGGQSWTREPNPPPGALSATPLNGAAVPAVIAPEAVLSLAFPLLAKSDAGAFKPCGRGECLQVQREEESCFPNPRPRAWFSAGCGDFAACPQGLSTYVMSMDQRADLVENFLQSYYREGDVCEGDLRCSGPKLEFKRTCPDGNYYGLGCHQTQAPDESDERLRFACSLGMRMDQQASRCCAQEECDRSRVQPATQLVQNCLRWQDERADCVGYGFSARTDNTIGEACAPNVREHCRRNAEDPLCREWCGRNRGSKLGDWCEDVGL